MVKSLRINNKKIYVCICALIVLFVSVLCLNRVKSNNKAFAEESSDVTVSVSLNDGFSNVLFGIENVSVGENFAFSVPNRANYTFIGWKYQENYLTDSLGVGIGTWSLTQNVTLIAGWDPDDKIIQFDTGTNTIVVNSIEIEYGSKVVLPHDIVRNGYYIINGVNHKKREQHEKYHENIVESGIMP